MAPTDMRHHIPTRVQKNSSVSRYPPHPATKDISILNMNMSTPLYNTGEKYSLEIEFMTYTFVLKDNLANDFSVPLFL